MYIYTGQVQCIHFEQIGSKLGTINEVYAKGWQNITRYILATSRCSVAGHIHTVEQRATLMEIIRLQKHSFYILPQLSLHMCYLLHIYIQRTLYYTYVFINSRRKIFYCKYLRHIYQSQHDFLQLNLPTMYSWKLHILMHMNYVSKAVGLLTSLVSFLLLRVAK